LLVGAACGGAWGVIATLVHLAMFRGLLPAPTESSLLIALLLYVVRAPFVAAIGIFVALGRRSSTLEELLVGALILGSTAGVAVGAVLAGSWRSANRSTRRQTPT
jgi:hypothetical protein